MYKVFTYWEGKRPLYIQKCLDTIERLSKVDSAIYSIILTPENVDTFLKGTDLHKNWKKLSCISHRADCIRVAIMCKYGGLYVDADTVFLKSPAKLMDIYHDLHYIKWSDGRILNGYFLCKENSPIMLEWLDKINFKLSLLGSRTFVWTEFGERILMPLVYNKYMDNTHEIKKQHFLPIDIDIIPEVFFERAKLDGFLFDDVYAVGLNHSYFCDNHKSFVKIDNINDLTKGNLLINDIMRKTINE